MEIDELILTEDRSETGHSVGRDREAGRQKEENEPSIILSQKEEPSAKFLINPLNPRFHISPTDSQYFMLKGRHVVPQVKGEAKQKGSVALSWL